MTHYRYSGIISPQGCAERGRREGGGGGIPLFPMFLVSVSIFAVQHIYQRSLYISVSGIHWVCTNLIKSSKIELRYRTTAVYYTPNHRNREFIIHAPTISLYYAGRCLFLERCTICSDWLLQCTLRDKHYTGENYIGHYTALQDTHGNHGCQF